MTDTSLNAPQFTDEKAAIEHLEASRWPDGPICPHCGSVTVTRMGGETQAGYFQCNDCRDKFTARTGTVMERSHIPVHKWLLAIHLLSACKKGMSAHQLHRMLGVTYKWAWFLAHRIREAMSNHKPKSGMGGAGHQCRPTKPITATRPNARSTTRKATHNKSGIVGLVNPPLARPARSPLRPQRREESAKFSGPMSIAATTLVTDEIASSTSRRWLCEA